ncbi:MAG: hypothetical protein Kow0037_25820 [Calditrichia bacterium]
MKMFTKILNICLLLIMLAGQQALAYKKVKVFILQPPEQTLTGVKRIAVLNFEGNQGWGEKVSSAFLTKLMDPERGMHDLRTGFLGSKKLEGKTFQEGAFTNVFEIVEREQLQKILEEQQMGMTGLLNDQQAVSIGQLLGVQAIITGKVQFQKSQQRTYQNRRVKNNEKNQTVKVPCQQHQVNLTADIRIISTETGQILGNSSAKQTAKDEHCEGDYGNIKTIEELAEQCLDLLTTELANYIAPHFRDYSFELEKIKAEPFKKIAEKAAKEAENLRIDAAYLLYRSIYEKDAYNPKLLYNMGILNEVVGNFAKAREFYEMALQLDDKDDYRKALNRVEKNVAFSEALASIGVVIQEHDFEVSQKSIQRVLAQKVKIKGKREERFPVYEQPQNGAKVVAQVPGDVTFTVVSQNGDWYLIKLLGGKQGYIHKSKVEVVN